MTQSQANKFTFNDDTSILLDIENGVFKPNTTSSILISAVDKYINKPCKLLDLGSGTGVIGIALSLRGLALPPLYSSDICENAVACVKENCGRHDISACIKCGSLFEPWSGEKFDCIVDCVSGIAQDAANLSPWYSGITCDAGDDGTKLTSSILRDAPKYLNKKGLLFFPVISLSNVAKIIDLARANFTHVELLEREEWPLPECMYRHMDTLIKMKEEEKIQLENKFGIVVCYTDVYVAYNN